MTDASIGGLPKPVDARTVEPVKGAGGLWRFAVAPEICTGGAQRPHMFGGAGLAAALTAMSAECGGRQPVWGGIHFIRPAPADTVIAMNVAFANVGRRVAHGRVEATVEDELVFTVAASFRTDGEPAVAGQWACFPQAALRSDCPEIRAHKDADRDIHSQFELRLARGRFGIFSRDTASGDGRVLVWMRHRSSVIDFPILALMSDFLPSITSDALGVRAGGWSLDNTIRFARLVPTEWVLAEMRIAAVAHGFGSGDVRLWTEDGSLLATASQSFLLKLKPRPEETARLQAMLP